VFERGNRADRHAIFIVKVDGTGLRRITPWGLDAAQPDWSPDGHWILFRSQESDERQNNQFLVHPNGSDLHRITHLFGGHQQWLSAKFSPDGRFIVASLAPGHGKPGYPDIYVMNADGSDLHAITHTWIWDSGVNWGPQPS
jgi:TolB protein